MTVSEYIADFLIHRQVAEAFGIPGGVVLDLLYAFDARKPQLTPHLCYHEQSAGFAAAGYAQASGRLGVAYATKGPGFTNLLTPMADAYYDSTPVLFITAHTACELPKECRCVTDQDMDTCGMVAQITKFAARIDRAEDVAPVLQTAYTQAMTGRKGPVFLDIAARLWKTEIHPEETSSAKSLPQDTSSLVQEILEAIQSAQRPVLLIGDGVNQSGTGVALREWVEQMKIPVLSSRYSHNLLADSAYYYGYVGSHGVRYANFILSKADLVISFGNRLNFPAVSSSFAKVVEQACFLRYDVDDSEFDKHTAMPKGRIADLQTLLPALVSASVDMDIFQHVEWISVCDIIRTKLWNEDVDEVTQTISAFIQGLSSDHTLVCDVGNNEFWVSRACVYARALQRTLYSKSFGALGNALGKAIGTYYATQRPVVAFVGDQGLQLNIQELQFIAQHRLPITIVVLNNQSSGMIKDRERAAGFAYSLHTTADSEYGYPNFNKVAKAYGLDYKRLDVPWHSDDLAVPCLLEVAMDTQRSLAPYLPKGKLCQELQPAIDNNDYDYLNSL
jgi:acetolactate synthase-1/2/3 large subunit